MMSLGLRIKWNDFPIKNEENEIGVNDLNNAHEDLNHLKINFFSKECEKYKTIKKRTYSGNVNKSNQQNDNNPTSLISFFSTSQKNQLLMPFIESWLEKKQKERLKRKQCGECKHCLENEMLRRNNGHPSHLIHYHKLPDWAKDNELIHGYYRKVNNSYIKCFKSMFQIHNETGNILSHFICGLYFILLTYWSINDLMGDPSATYFDIIAMSCFLMGALACFFFSSFFHSFLCHSEHVNCTWAKIDYIGIICVTSGGITTLVTFVFYHHPILKTIYLLGNIITSLLVLKFFLRDDSNKPHLRLLRPFIVGANTLAGVIPFLHMLKLEADWRSLDLDYPPQVQVLNYYMIRMMACLMIGSVFYGFRIPEVFSPGKYDLFGHSHQIFHCFIGVGIYFLYLACKHSFIWRGDFFPNEGGDHVENHILETLEEIDIIDIL